MILERNKKPTENQTSMLRIWMNELLWAPAFFLKYSKRIIRAPGTGSKLASVPYEITVIASLYGILILNRSPES